MFPIVLCGPVRIRAVGVPAKVRSEKENVMPTLSPPPSNQPTPRPAAASSPARRSAADGWDLTCHRCGDCLVLTVGGDLDIYTVADVRRRVGRLVGRGERLIVDLRSVELVDSCGLGMLVSLRNRFATSPQTALVVTDHRFKDILRITGVSEVLPHFATVEDACAALCADATTAAP